MNYKITFKVEEGVSFIVTTESRNIEELQKASDKYEAGIPDARIIIVYNN